MKNEGLKAKGFKRIKCKYLDIALILSFAAALGIIVLKKGLGILGHEYAIINSAIFPVISIFANVFILKLAQSVLSVSGIKLKKEHYIGIGTAFFTMLIF